MTEAFPGEGTTAAVVVKADASDGRPVRGRPRTGSRPAPRRPTTSSTPAREQVEVSDDGTTTVLRLAMPYDESDDRVDTAIEQLRDDLAPAALDDLDAEYAVGGGAAESLDFVNQQQERLPLVIGIVLLLTLLMMGVAFRSVPIALVSTVLNLASVAAAFGILTLVFQHGYRGRARLHQPGLRHRLDPAVRDGGPGRAVDGLPRVRPQPGPRARRPGPADAAGRRARRQRHRRRGDQRGRRDGLGVRDLRDAVDDGDEDDGRRPVGGDPARRDGDPPGDAARDPGPARRPRLVAAADGPAGRASRWWRRSRRTSWPAVSADPPPRP